MSAQYEEGLAYNEYNKDAESSILLIHGGWATGQEWNGVGKHLQGYHLIVPDVQGHGRSQVNGLHFSLHECVDKLAGIVRKLAKQGKAYIVGLSAGSHLGVHLLSRHPDVCREDAVLSGFNSYPSLPTPLLAIPAWFFSRIAYTFLSTRNKDTSDFSDMSYQVSYELMSVVTTEDWPSPWPARTLIVAAANKGVPVADRLVNSQDLAKIGQHSNPDTCAYRNASIMHAWHKDEPKLFADTVMCWLNKTALPEGFVRI